MSSKYKNAITLKNINPDKFVNDFVKEFNLSLYPYFKDIPKELILLIASPNCNINKYNYTKNINNLLIKKYNVCSHQSLETYGDTVLYMILVDLLIDLYQLNIKPADITYIKNSLLSNRHITNIMLTSDLCKFILSDDYLLNPAHNKCADLFEALIGGLYFHLKTEHKDINPLDAIKIWLTKHTSLISDLNDIIKDYGLSKSSKYVNISENISKLLTQDVTKDLFEEDINFEFRPPKKTIFITPDDSFDSIISKLGVEESDIKTETSDEGIIYIYFPLDKPIIGVGTSINDAKDNLIDLLVQLGYISEYYPVSEKFV